MWKAGGGRARQGDQKRFLRRGSEGKNANAVDSLIFTVTTKKKKSPTAGKNSCPDLNHQTPTSSKVVDPIVNPVTISEKCVPLR